jgi:hypothetical protein
MLGWRGGGFWLAAAIGFISGCASSTMAYDGPRVPQAELAHIEGDRVAIRIIDDNRIADNSAEILPGEHAVTVSLFAALRNRYGFRTKFKAKGDQTVCFTAFERRRYLVQPALNQSLMTEDWRAAVFDRKAELFVDHPCPVAPRHPAVSRVSVQSPFAADAAVNSASPPAAPVRQKTDSE